MQNAPSVVALKLCAPGIEGTKVGARLVSKEGQLHLVRSQAMHESPDCNVHLAIYLVKLLESSYLHTYTNTENMQK